MKRSRRWTILCGVFGLCLGLGLFAILILSMLVLPDMHNPHGWSYLLTFGGMATIAVTLGGIALGSYFDKSDEEKPK